MSQVGFVTLSYNGEKYVLGDHFLENGESIEYANFMIWTQMDIRKLSYWLNPKTKRICIYIK